MRSWLIGVALCLVMCLAGSVCGQELDTQPFRELPAAYRLDKGGAQGRFGLSDALARAREPEVRLLGWSRTESELDGGAAGRIVPLSSRTDNSGSLEIVPYTGYQIGGRFTDEFTDTTLELADASTWGFLVGYNYTRYSQIEFYYSHQETELSSGGLIGSDKLFDLDVDYYHIGGTYKFDHGKWEPFAVGTVGLSRFDPKSSEASSLTRFSLGLGGGVRYFPIKRVGLYLAGRAFVTFVESQVWVSGGSGGTTIAIASNTLWQLQFMTGAVIVF